MDDLLAGVAAVHQVVLLHLHGLHLLLDGLHPDLSDLGIWRGAERDIKAAFRTYTGRLLWTDGHVGEGFCCWLCCLQLAGMQWLLLAGYSWLACSGWTDRMLLGDSWSTGCSRQYRCDKTFPKSLPLGTDIVMCQLLIGKYLVAKNT